MKRLKRHTPTILSGMAVVGVIGTSVLAVKATPKALILLKEAEEEKDDKLSIPEIICTAGPVYIPAIIVGASTIGCILGANALNQKQQATLTSAYILLDNSYREYKKKVEEMQGEGINREIIRRIAKDGAPEISEDTLMYGEKMLFFDSLSNQYFESTIADVRKAEYDINRRFAMDEFVSLNEFYNLLNINTTPQGEIVGWSVYNSGANSTAWIDFEHDLVMLDGDVECWIITYPNEPTADYLEY